MKRSINLSLWLEISLNLKKEKNILLLICDLSNTIKEQFNIERPGKWFFG